MGLIEIGQYAGAITAIAVLFGMTIKWLIVKPIKTYIDTMTYAIQPHANGGRALPDVAKAVSRIESKMCDLDTRLVSIEELVTKPTRSKKSAN